ncbi:uncharacterized protein BT62DRAFT_1011565 [Guyanagaster necrorhizus]|uniref:Uncharacterized protein n=1 Tax=Guyanagaster necrorhizus TaxID=856835 RepID=A0A9P8ANA0_9AGAR|nr:uncharacterized protein BT62DRAFT_1011565 [Guyanagaster necrorhizus MCA 3950]KAG7441546.1 hypothetical protein BT62DRAFT_1011565 [Guyanagaster necrorhizus MCA 3950]
MPHIATGRGGCDPRTGTTDTGADWALGGPGSAARWARILFISSTSRPVDNLFHRFFGFVDPFESPQTLVPHWALNLAHASSISLPPLRTGSVHTVAGKEGIIYPFGIRSAQLLLPPLPQVRRMDGSHVNHRLNSKDDLRGEFAWLRFLEGALYPSQLRGSSNQFHTRTSHG